MHSAAALICAALLFTAADGAPRHTVLRSGEAVQHTTFEGHSRWKIVPHLWTDKAVNITCTFSKDFKVYVANSFETLSDKVERGESVWCGWHSFLGQKGCVARLSPFGTTHVAIAHDVATSRRCEVEVSEHISPFMIIQTLVGAFFVLHARQLSASMFFRLGTGSAGVMMLSVVILLFMLSRTLPNKKSAAALFAVFGSSFTGMMRYVFGQWIPSFEQLVYNKIFLAYMALSGVVGLAVTYYYDRDDNIKLHNILKYGLKLLGLLLLAFSTSMPEASVTLCCLLLAAQLAEPAMVLWRKGEVSSKTLTDLVSESTGGARRGDGQGRLSTPGGVELSGTDARTDDEAADYEDSMDGEEEPSSEAPARGSLAWAARAPFPDEGGLRTPAAASEYRGSRGAGTPGDVAMPLGMDASDSPWLKRGLALNLETGRTVQMGGSTWNKLILRGYQLDRLQGTLTPPNSKRKEGIVAGSSPASRVKARRSPG